MQDAAYLFEKNWCGDPHTTAAPPVAVFMVFSGRDTFHVSTEERQTASSSEVRAERNFYFFSVTHERNYYCMLSRDASHLYSSRVPCYSGRERRLDAERTACPVRTKGGIPSRNETCRTLPLRRENKALTYLSAKRMTPKRPDDLTERERTTLKETWQTTCWKTWNNRGPRQPRRPSSKRTGFPSSLQLLLHK